MGSSLPFPSKKMYGTNEEGDGNCDTEEQAIQACKDAGVTRFLTEQEVRDQYI
jgi:hypothetical protein